MKRASSKRMRWRRGFSARSRQGIAVIMILGLLSLTMAVSYVMLRTQATSQLIQQNGSRLQLARRAARTGLSVALQKMHQSSWAGVGTSFTASMSSHETYTATYTAGDATLTATSTDYGQLPYRVTIDVTGSSTDPSSASIVSTSKLRAIVQFVPRALNTAPSNWDTVRTYALYQSANDTFKVNAPARIDGAVRLQSAVDLQGDSTMPSNAQQRYLGDLNAMRSAGMSDYRPFNGPIEMPVSSTSSTVQALLSTQLGVTLTNVSQASLGWSWPGAFDTYKLYSGGPSYSIPQLASPLSNTTLSPSPETNPLGLFYCSGDLQLANNVTINGTVIASGDITFTGTGVSITPPSLPALYGTSQSIQLTAALAGDDVTVSSGSTSVLAGPVVCWDDFDVPAGSDTTAFSVRGVAVSKKFTLRGRTNWTSVTSSTWSDWETQYTGQRTVTAQNPNPILYFPEWLRQKQSLSSQPLLKFTSASSGVRHQFPTRNDAVFVKHGSDPGLRWDLLSVKTMP